MSNRRFLFSGSGNGERLKFYPNMKAIIAEKPSVGMDIARVVGATEKKDGYCTGNGYMVTWALGHLVSLALPGTYGYTKTAAEDLPMIPEPFRLVARQIKTAKGMVTDMTANKQLKTIDEVFSKCDRIIVATDAGREGELIFRWIYDYLGYTKPFQRLWISSLTDEAIREGMANLRDGSDYDSLYAAADSRAKADWLVGMNASRALAIASGSANSSIGRVQTPTLAMICARFKENRSFVSTPYWQLHITLKQGEAHRQFVHPEEFKDKETAGTAYRKITSGSVATVTKVERKRTSQQAPLLYDLTTLQKDCNIHYDLTADKTLSIAQALYEKKLISYPRTGSRYIPEDVMAHIPSLLEKVVAMPDFKEYGNTLDFSGLNTRSVDNAKVTDHHALVITGIAPQELSEAESAVYTLIAGRMLESFSPPCEKESLVMECTCEGMDFCSRSSVIISPGWRGVFRRKEDRDKDEPEGNEGSAVFAEGEKIMVMGHGLAQKKTMPKPLYTEATLLAAMETCGKHITDEQAKEAIGESGIGTPATRAAIITTLVGRDYIARSGKSVVPTEKGMLIYEAVKDMRVADVELTGSWEKALLQIEGHTLDTETFMRSIRDYTGKATDEILRLSLQAMPGKVFTCPKCKTGKIIIRSKVAKCDHDGCGLLVFRRILNKELTDQHLEQLLSSGSTKLIKGFKGKKGVSFDAAVTFDENYNPVFSFPKPKNGKANSTVIPIHGQR
jgi:DNA topoisomerase-3